MSRNYNAIPTFLGYSEETVGVIAGGGLFGYGGIVLHEPTQAKFREISEDLEDAIEPKGVGFNYNDVATITVSGLLKWTNFNLDRAPKGSQDVRETGPVRIEVFDKEDMRQFIEERSSLFERLGITFIG